MTTLDKLLEPAFARVLSQRERAAAVGVLETLGSRESSSASKCEPPAPDCWPVTSRSTRHGVGSGEAFVRRLCSKTSML